MQEDAETREKQVGKVRGQMSRCLKLDRQWQRAPPDAREQFLASLDRPFRPAMLLRFEAIHVYRQLSGSHNIIEKNELPASKLRAITEVQILGQRVMLPAARVQYARFAPEPGRAVEIEKASTATACDLLEEQMSIQKHRLHPGEK